jgi:hypothetical protein
LLPFLSFLFSSTSKIAPPPPTLALFTERGRPEVDESFSAPSWSKEEAMAASLDLEEAERGMGEGLAVGSTAVCRGRCCAWGEGTESGSGLSRFEEDEREGLEGKAFLLTDIDGGG